MKPYQKNKQEIQFIRSIENLSRVYSKEQAIFLIQDSLSKMDEKIAKKHSQCPKKKLPSKRNSISKNRKLEILFKDFEHKPIFRSSYQTFLDEVYDGVYDIEIAA